MNCKLNVFSIAMLLLAIFALVNYSAARKRAKFNCVKCSKICKFGQTYWGTLQVYCNRCAAICDNVVEKSPDPWKKMTKLVKTKKHKFNGTVETLNMTPKPTVKNGTEGRSFASDENAPADSALSWWGRR